MRLVRLLVIVGILGALALNLAMPVAAADIGLYAFSQVWQRTDQPVTAKQTSRAWVWGPGPISPLLTEPYAEGNLNGRRGVRWVQYFDKGRMQITDSTANSTAPGYVSVGLLAQEMITGKLQLGNHLYSKAQPAQINVVGDETDPTGPTYATFSSLIHYAPIPLGWQITQFVDRSGHVSANPSLAGYGVTSAVLDPATNHTIASVFWDYMNSSGSINDGFESAQGRLFPDAYLATGNPISEAYWTIVKVGGKPTLMLVQAFEKRVLTYTPSNPDGFKVESNNVGRHYYEWRYLYQGGDPLQIGSLSYAQDPSGHWVFLGDVTNMALAAYGRVQVTVNLYDAGNKLLGSADAYLDLSVVAPSEQVPFRVWFDSGVSFSRAEVLVDGQPADTMAAPALTLQGAPIVTIGGGAYVVSGMVKNETKTRLSYVAYVMALYDANGWVVGYDWGIVNPSTLGPGQSAGFTAMVVNPPASVVSYKLFFTGT